jgi:outer membrane autotransporter protein
VRAHGRFRLSDVSQALLLTGLFISAVPRVQGAVYVVSNEAELRQAVIDANANGDPASTITLANDIVIADPNAFATIAKPLTINTGAFTVTGAIGTGTTGPGLDGLSFLRGPVTVDGAVVGGGAAASNSSGTGGVGVSRSGGEMTNLGAVTGGKGGSTCRTCGAGRIAGTGGAGVAVTDGFLVNEASGFITGGSGGDYDAQNGVGSSINAYPGGGGAGVTMVGGSLDNRGAIIGGNGGIGTNFPSNADNIFARAGGTGVELTGGSHINSGTIAGGEGGIGKNQGASGHGAGGVGLYLTGGGILINSGSINGEDGRSGGGSSAASGSFGGTGAVVTAGSTLENSGTITGGNSGTSNASGGGLGISGENATVINSGVVNAGLHGNGTQANAIEFTGGVNMLELRSGSTINGNVKAFGANDTLALGGSTDDSFDIGKIGAAKQYRSFGIFEKKGASTWTLTGATVETTPWTLTQGALSVSDDAKLGADAGALTFNGGVLQVTGTSFTGTARVINWGASGGGFDIADAENTFTVGQSLVGGGPLTKFGAGALVMTGENTYAGGTTIASGTLQLGDGGTSGSIVGDVVNNGALAFNRADDVIFDGVISGTGRVNQIGPGTTILTNASTYTGGTIIAQGSLQLGNGGTTGSIVGDVVNNGALAFNRSDTFVFNGVVSGSGTLSQIGTGTTVLTAENRYSGGTTIASGTLQLGDGGTTGSIVGDVANDGTLAFNRADTLTFGGTISGAGAIRQIGAGMTRLTADSSVFEGATTVEAGTLSVNGRLGGSMDVLGGRLQGIGTVGSTTHFAGGTIAPGNSIGTLTIEGDYVGDGGTLEIETELGGDDSPTDRLVVTGNTSGSTRVKVINVGGTGALTAEGIKIVDVGGASNGTFALRGDYVFQGQPAVVGGAYGYRLYQHGVRTPADGDWYLRSTLFNPPDPTDPDPAPLYQPGVPAYEVYAQVLQGLNALGTLQQRVGNRYWSGAGAVDGSGFIEGSGVWGRIEGVHSHFDPKVTTSSTGYDVNTFKLRAGVDGQLHDSDSGKLIGGFMAHYGHAWANASSLYGDGDLDTDGYGFGGTLTWYGAKGFYADGQAQLTWYDSDLSSRLARRRLAEGIGGFGYGLSLETGQRIDLDRQWTITPQAQLAYSEVDFDGFKDVFGAKVALDRGNSLRGRLGISTEYQDAWQDDAGQIRRTKLYWITNLYNEFLEGVKADVSGTKFASRNDRFWGGVGVGGSFNWGDDRYSIYGEAAVNTSLANFADSYWVNGTVGLRVVW